MSTTDIEATLQSLTLEEKAALCSGMDAWQTQAVPGKVESIWMADGPHGLRKEDRKNRKANGGMSVRATCFPPECTLACSWSEELVAQVGKAIADECKASGVSVLLGPGVNIKRSPLCGRNFEYYSEDPVLAGKLAAAMIRGVEGEGVGTSLKHFAVNNQETKRMSISAEVDERALREIYLKPFEIAVKEGSPSTVMASYNRVNGVYATENKTLLRDILRGEWGFDGLVMSDWGAVHNRLSALEAGLDLEMPYSGYYTKTIVTAVQSGALDEKVLDDAVRNVLHLVEKGLATEKGLPFDAAAHHALAADALRRSAVLLKNEGILPLDKHTEVAVIGAMAGAQGRFQGSGSSVINPTDQTDFLQAFARKNIAQLRFMQGYALDTDAVHERMEEAAVCLAKTARQVIYFMGLTEEYETEGYDRETLRLPQNQVHLLERLVKENENVVVVLTAGSAVETPWLDKVKALLYLGLGGQSFGEAAYDLLYGLANPSGKLTETWPITLEETPAAQHFPMGPAAVTYNESIYVGYRYYDKATTRVQFPFGFGLSYTQFVYSDLQLQSDSLAKDEALRATFTVENTGACDGTEVAQLYLTHNDSAVFRPLRELKAFARVALKAGERKSVTLTVPYEMLSVFFVPQHRWVVEAGEYTVSIGPHSRLRPLSAVFCAQGETLPKVQEIYGRKGPYGTFACNDFPADDFETLLGHKPEQNEPTPPGLYTWRTTLGEMTTPAAQKLSALALRVARHNLHFSPNPKVNRRVAECGVRDLPFKNVPLNLRGLLSQPAADVLLAVCNGQASWRDFWRALRKK